MLGKNKTSKGESNRLLIERNKLKHPVYVGDTQGDAQSAIDAGIPFIYANGMDLVKLRSMMRG